MRFLPLALSVCAFGCGSAAAQSYEDEGLLPVENVGSAPVLAYPDGPYGFARGLIIPDLFFAGYLTNGQWASRSLSPFHNPLTLGKDRLLFIDVSATWCGGSKTLAANLAVDAPKYRPYGVSFRHDAAR